MVIIMKKLIALRKYGILIVVLILIYTGCTPNPEQSLHDVAKNTDMLAPVKDVPIDSISGLELSSLVFISVSHHQCIASLVDSSSVIIIGEIITDNIHRLINRSQYFSDYTLYTISELKVSRVIRGEVRVGDIIRVRQLGGVYNNNMTIEVLPAFDYFYTGQYGVFFINFDTEKCMSASVHLYQGFVEIVDGVIKNDDPLSLFENGMPEEDLIELLLKKL